MDSVMEDDPTLPLDLEKSTNLARFKEAVASGHFGQELLNTSGDFPEGGLPEMSEQGRDGAASSQIKTMRDYELQMSELKKENFGLKLRIYFLEERLSHSDTPEDIFKMNIELKVTVEELKKELVEKQQLLIKASDAVEMIANHSDSQIKQIKEEHLQELTKVRGDQKDMEKELETTKQDLEDMAERLTEAVNMNQKLNERLESAEALNEGSMQGKKTLNVKDKMIDELNEALENQRTAYTELEDNNKTLEEEKQRAQDDLRKLVEGEKKLKNLAEELTKRNQSFEDLKEKSRRLEKINRELRNQLHESERQGLNSRNSADSLNGEQHKNKTKIDDLEKSLAAARESAHTAKMKWYQTFEEHSEVVRSRDGSIASLQTSILAKETEIERLKQSVLSKGIELQKLGSDKIGLEKKLDDVLQQKDKEMVGLANQLKELSNQYNSKTIEMEEHYRKVVHGAHDQVGIKDRIISKLTSSNSEKDKIIEDFAEALKDVSSQNITIEDTNNIQDTLMKKLQNHVKQKERAVQTALDEKFNALEEKDIEMQQLRQALRERDRLLQKINSAVVDAEKQVQLYEKVVHEKDAIIQQLKTVNQEEEQSHKNALESVMARQQETNAMLEKLKTAFDDKEKQLLDLKRFVQDVTKNSSMSQTDNGLKFQDMTEELQEKNKRLEELLHERARVASTNETNAQLLMKALQEKDNLLKEASNVLNRVQSEKNSTIQHLQGLLNNKEHEVQSLENTKAWVSQEHELLVKKLRAGLRDKDTVIEQLVESNKEKDRLLVELQDSLNTPKKNQNSAEMTTLQQANKEMEAALRSKNNALKKLQEQHQASLRKSDAELKKADNRMKIENLQQELKAKESLLQQSKETIENLRNKLKTMPIIEDLKQKFAEQNQALLEAQKTKELAQMELAVLKTSKLEYDTELKAKHDNIDMLSHAAHIKDNMIQEMQDSHKKQLQDMQDNVHYYQRKAHDLETSNDALRQQVAECSELNASLQKQLESAQNRAKIQSPSRQEFEELNRLREEVITLRAKTQLLSTPQREQTNVGAGDDEMEEEMTHLQRVLQQQVKETIKLNDILSKEREMYINVVQHLRASPSDANRSAAVNRELQTLKALRTQLEDGIKQNNVLRNQLQDQITSQHARQSPLAPPHSPYDAVYQREIQELKSRLEDTERWNSSLQARLNDSSSDGKAKADEAAKEAVHKLEEQIRHLTKSLHQTTTMNNRLNNEMDEIKKSSQRISSEKDSQINHLNSQIATLQDQLGTTKRTFTELDNRLKDANVKLEYYARNVNGDFEDLLLEREIEVDSLRGQLNELQLRAENGQGPKSTDMSAQTSPFTANASKGMEERLCEQLSESRQWNETYKKLLKEKDRELQRLRESEMLSTQLKSHSDIDMASIHKLRKEYEKGIRTNEDLKHQLDVEIEAVSTRERSLQTDVMTLSDLRQKLDESLRCNDSLQGILRDNLKSGSNAERVKKELILATKQNESLALQIENLHHSIKKFNDVDTEADKLRKDLQQAHILNQDLNQQLKDVRGSAAELPMVQRELKQSQMMNEQLGKQLSDVLNHVAKLKTLNHELKSEIDHKKQMIANLEQSLLSKKEDHRRSTSLFVVPPRVDHALTQTSPGYGLSSPPTVTRVTTPPGGHAGEVSPTSVIEKMHKLNQTLMEENQFLRNKLKQNERYTTTLKDELELYNRMKRDSIDCHTDTPTSTAASSGQSIDDVLAVYMNEMRELRIRLEESIRTNDKLRAQLEKRMAEGEVTDGGRTLFSTEQSLNYLHETETLRAELLAKDKTNDELRKKLESLTKTREMENSQLNILRQQVAENQEVMNNLQNELRVYEQLYKISTNTPDQHYQGTSYVREGPRSPNSTDNNTLLTLLAEVRRLRLQLEKSINTNNALRLKLEEQLNRPIRDSPILSSVTLSSVTRRLDLDENMNKDKTGSTVHGHLAAHIDRDVFIELQGKIECIYSESTKLTTQMQTERQPLWVENSVKNVKTWATDCKTMLDKFVIDERIDTLSDDSSSNENMTLRLQISKLKKKLTRQEDVIKRASQQLEESTKKKEGLQAHLIDRLLESQSVLQRARGSLEDCTTTSRRT